MNHIDSAAQTVWDYLCLDEPVSKSDVILVLGSHDLRVATRGAELYLQEMAPLLIFSGGFGRLTEGFVKPEAEMFAEIAIKAGVPESAILIENKSTNTGQNIELSYEKLKQKGLDPNSFILVTKPYMERRALATFKKRLPGKQVTPTSPQIDFEHYPAGNLSKEEVINIMIGDLERIKVYPEKGFQIPMDIPEEVWGAFEKLVKMGFTEHLVKT
jgi:uncharacterized SAM-binding protein YcdF (DUF218 family)